MKRLSLSKLSRAWFLFILCAAMAHGIGGVFELSYGKQLCLCSVFFHFYLLMASFKEELI